MYKDKDRQREANRERQRRYRTKRDKHGVTKGVTNRRKGVTSQGVTAKRGKDIKCFADLPPDVQQTIDRMSIVDGKTDQTIKANRTAIAIHYQRLFQVLQHRSRIDGQA